LHHAPDQLTDCERETDRRNAKASMGIQRRDEQTRNAVFVEAASMRPFCREA